MAILLTLNSRKFLAAVKDMYVELGRPANAMQVANRLGFDAYVTTSCLVELLGMDLIHYPEDLYGERTLEQHADDELLMVTARGQDVIDGVA